MRILELFGVRYAWLRDTHKRVIRKRIKRDPFGDYVDVNDGWANPRVELLPDGKTNHSLYTEWRGRGLDVLVKVREVIR